MSRFTRGERSCRVAQPGLGDRRLDDPSGRQASAGPALDRPALAGSPYPGPLAQLRELGSSDGAGVKTRLVVGKALDEHRCWRAGGRQAFIREMGGTVIVAFLRQDAPVDSDRSLLAAMRSH